jgi:hypothetical protein
MSENETPKETTVSCEVCLKEVPPSSGKSVEAEDYVVHFCGLDCYKVWKEKGESKKP